jgi:hypothetical protein
MARGTLGVSMSGNLVCPSGEVTLGEWTTADEKLTELKAHSDRLKASNK